jgi:hypothetical protein
MSKIIKKILFIGLIIFLLMKLYQPARNIHYEQGTAANFTKAYKVPENVKTIFRTSCYDCHSNNTNYPWYASIQPIRLFMESHIKEGKENLNFDEFTNYSSRKQKNKLDRMMKQIKADEMPLSSYTIIHKNAILSKNKKAVVIDWINKTIDSISSQK